ncbi:MAG: hypothetical protein A2219_06635 [Elusimicrobia bacterium RIFOXYA2_FULL_50_26]|nr:MAG: hypothetical protein A2219_06635 [Elusimicrobia bacterium RIFOXYA2_FULL_50_26]OGS23912.1 MAG: hypothetical protein A2314_07425 [Elusimicrobia bacterium RIFOXYB2_FULL_50_12]
MIENGAKKAWVVSAIMGLGHTRAAYPLRDIAFENIIVEGSREFCQPDKYRIWHRLANMYYLLSRATGISIIGTYALVALQKIPPYYPLRDLSEPTLAVKYLNFLIRKHKLGSTLVEKVKADSMPVISTFYATAMAIEIAGIKPNDNYLLICDADINRVWVPLNPRESTIKYLAPCTQVKRRLLSYGVPEKNIYLVGFPLPKENIGDGKTLNVIKNDLFGRLVRLDPANKFFRIHGKDVLGFLEKDAIPRQRDDFFVLSFTVGGAGAQVEMAEKILKSLRDKIKQGKIKINLSAGVQKPVLTRFHEYIKALGLNEFVGNGINIIYDENVYAYMDKFDQMLRTTDVLWTKPSELSFYCGLGIPILLAPAVGTHEEYNATWLQEIHAGVKPAGPLEYTNEWLFDLRENGRLAEAAWDGFLKARKMGTYRIEELIATGQCTQSDSPLE